MQNQLQQHFANLNHTTKSYPSNRLSKRTHWSVMENPDLVETLSTLMTNLTVAEVEWVNTEEFMPINITDKTEIISSRLEYEPTLPEEIPDEYPAPLIQSHREYRSAKIRRFAIGAKYDKDSMMTERGQLEFMRSKMEIVLDVRLQLALDSIYCAMYGNGENQNFAERYFQQGSWRDKEKRSVYFFCIANKKERGFRHAVNETIREMEAVNVKPNIIVMDRRKASILREGSAQMSDYQLGGAKAVNRFLNNPPLGEVSGLIVRGVPVVQNGHNGMTQVSILDSRVQIGEYYVVDASRFVGLKKAQFFARGLYSVALHDEKHDKYTVVDVKEMVSRCGRWNRDGSLDVSPTQVSSDPFKVPGNDNIWKTTLGAFYDADTLYQSHFKQVVEGEINDVAPGYTHTTAGAGASGRYRDIIINRQNCEKMLDNNVPLPFSFLLAKPFMTYTTMGALIAQGGRQMGEMNLGYMDMGNSEDKWAKFGVSAYTFRSGPILHDEKCRYYFPNLVYSGTKYELGSNQLFEKEEIKTYVSKSRALKQTPLGGALLCMAVGFDANQSIKPQPFVDITGLTGRPGDNRQPHYDSWEYYQHVYALHMLSNTNLNRRTNERANTVCYHGAMRYNTGEAPNRFDGYVENSGHHGQDVYAGCMDVRNWGGEVLRATSKGQVVA